MLLFDASLQEGTDFQQTRGWFATTVPCGPAIGGFPRRFLRATYESDIPNAGRRESGRRRQ